MTLQSKPRQKVAVDTVSSSNIHRSFVSTHERREHTQFQLAPSALGMSDDMHRQRWRHDLSTPSRKTVREMSERRWKDRPHGQQ